MGWQKGWERKGEVSAEERESMCDEYVVSGCGVRAFKSALTVQHCKCMAQAKGFTF